MVWKSIGPILTLFYVHWKWSVGSFCITYYFWFICFTLTLAPSLARLLAMRTDPQWEHPKCWLAKQQMKIGETHHRMHGPAGWTAMPNLSYNLLAGLPFKTSNVSTLASCCRARTSAHSRSLVPTPLPRASELTITWSMYASPGLVRCKPSIGCIGWTVTDT